MNNHNSRILIPALPSFNTVTLDTSAYMLSVFPSVKWGYNLPPAFLPGWGYYVIPLNMKVYLQREADGSTMLQLSVHHSCIPRVLRGD